MHRKQGRKTVYLFTCKTTSCRKKCQLTEAHVRSTGHAIIQNQSVSTALMAALLDNNCYLIGVATLTGMLLL